MRRPLASALAAATLLAAPAFAGAAEPLDLELSRLGAPDPAVWVALGATASDAEVLARDAKARFGLLSSELALALSSAVLQPASTTGHSGFDFAFEVAQMQVHPKSFSSATTGTPPGWTAPENNWPTHAMTPHELSMAGFHVRKALPFSFEVGGRLLYLSQSSYFAGQLEGKWALNEGFETLPDLAIRFAWTELFGQRDYNLGTGDLDVMVSKRWGVNAVTSFTPYLVARFTFLNASTDPIVYKAAVATSPDPAVAAGFPTLRQTFYRTTGGVRMTAYAVSMALEGTWMVGATHDGKGAPTANEYPTFDVPSSLGFAFRFGFEF
jgi:hypothetical protein